MGAIDRQETEEFDPLPLKLAMLPEFQLFQYIRVIFSPLSRIDQMILLFIDKIVQYRIICVIIAYK